MSQTDDLKAQNSIAENLTKLCEWSVRLSIGDIPKEVLKHAALILGDNIIIGNSPIHPQSNTIYTYKVKDPSAYGVVEIDENGLIKKRPMCSPPAVGLLVFLIIWPG